MKTLILLLLFLVSYSSAYWECYVTNNYGYSFWGTGITQYEATNNAIRVCQSNTPMGMCYIEPMCRFK
jgi:hypothetical protein